MADHDPQPGEEYTIYGDRYRIVSRDANTLGATTVTDVCIKGDCVGVEKTMPLTMWLRLMATARKGRRTK